MKGKKYVDALKKYDRTKQYDMSEAIEKAIEMAEEALTKPFNFLSAVTKEEAEEILKEYKG